MLNYASVAVVVVVVAAAAGGGGGGGAGGGLICEREARPPHTYAASRVR